MSTYVCTWTNCYVYQTTIKCYKVINLITKGLIKKIYKDLPVINQSSLRQSSLLLCIWRGTLVSTPPSIVLNSTAPSNAYPVMSIKRPVRPQKNDKEQRRLVSVSSIYKWKDFFCFILILAKKVIKTIRYIIDNVLLLRNFYRSVKEENSSTRAKILTVSLFPFLSAFLPPFFFFMFLTT